MDPPTVPAADAYGGIGFRDTNKPDGFIKVVIPPNLMWAVGDSITLYWDDAAVANHVLGRDDLFLPLTMNVSVKTVQQIYDASGLQIAPVDVWYVFTSGNTDDDVESTPTTILVKLTLPGGVDPNPTETPYTNENLVPPEVPEGIIGTPEAEAGVPVTIPPWPNMAEGDVVRIRWGTLSVSRAPLSADEVGQPVVIIIEHDIIIDAGDSEQLSVTYDIDDIVSEWSLYSLPAFVHVEAGDAILDRPVVLEAQDGNLDYDGLNGADANIIVSFQDPPMAVGGELHFVFDGLSSDGHSLKREFDERITTPAPIISSKLFNTVIRAVTPGTASLYYFVRDNTGANVGRSQRTSLTLSGVYVPLPAPSVVEAVDGELDPEDAPNGATVVVSPWPTMSTGDVVTIQWDGKKASGLPMTHSEEKTVTVPGVALNYLVPPGFVTGLAGGSVDVYYIVRPAKPDAQTRESEHLALTVLGESMLDAPDVDGVAGGELNPPEDPSAGVDVTVPVWELMSVGDVLEIFWEGQTPAGSTDHQDTMAAGDLNKPYVFTVPRAVVNANAAAQQSVDVWYRVTRAGQTTPQDSAINRFRVQTPPLDKLPPPEVDEAVGDILDPEPLPPAGATVRVKPYEGMENGDSVTIWFGQGTGAGEHSDTFDVTQNMVGDDITLRVPKAKVQLFLGSTVTVNYHVLHKNGTERDSQNLVLTVRTEAKWPAPGVNEAEGDYLDPEMIDFGVTTRVFSYSEMQRDDVVVLHWGNQGDAGYYTDSITLSTVRDYQFRLAPEDVTPWVGKTVPIWYHVERGAQRFTSEMFFLRIGVEDSDLLEAPHVEEAEDGILDLSMLGASATAHIPVYDGMALSDHIYMTWGGGPGSGGLEWRIDVTLNAVGKPITRQIPMVNLTPFEGKDVVLVYTVDNGTPPIRESAEYIVRVQRGSMDLPAPEVPAVRDDGVLDPRDVPQGAEVVVERAAQMQQGDTIRLHWDSTKDGGSTQKTQIVGPSQNPILFTIELDTVIAGVDGGVSVWYEIVRAGNTIDTSEKLEFSIKLSALPLPVIDQADGASLDPDDVPASGATVTIEAIAILRQNDVIVLTWAGVPGNGTGEYRHTVTPGEAGGAVKITVPKAIVLANNGVTIELSYTVTRAAGGPVEESGAKIYDVRRELGTGDLLVMGARLNGTIYRASGTSQYMRALHRTSRADLLAEWRYDDELVWTTGVSFKDTRPWVPLHVRSATDQVTINPGNIFGSGTDGVNVQGNAAFVALRMLRNVVGWGAFAALCSDGTVVAWGNDAVGGSTESVAAQLVDVRAIYGNSESFTAVLGGGGAVTWGVPAAGGNSSSVKETLDRDLVYEATSAVRGRAMMAPKLRIS
ncbi:hypothetical protein ACPWR0_17810 [Pandoraea pneumonica]|uniref:hypothetical protein n=1 Tax=Pandoraea pneumonica TaxID=2508299 RepID=UPI003CEE8DB2